jgi:hypothetical protein
MCRALTVVLLVAAAGSRDTPSHPATVAQTAATAPTAPTIPVPGGARRMPALPAGVFALSFAEASRTSAAWSAVADGYATELATCSPTSAECRELGYQVVLARYKVIDAGAINPPPGDDPVPIPPEVEAHLAAIDAYRAMLDPTDPEASKMTFLGAAALWRWRQDAAIPRLAAVLRDHRDDETAEYAANQLLDLLVRTNRTHQLQFWVAELAADETFLQGKPELREALERLRILLASH